MVYSKKNSRSSVIIRLCCNVYFKFGCVFAVCSLLGIVIPLFFGYKDTEEKSCKISFEYQIDCMPDVSRVFQTKENCIKRNCCWNRINYLQFPYCYHKLPTTQFYTIKYESLNKYFLAKLNDNNSSLQKELEINVVQWNKNHLNIEISPKNKTKQTEYLFCQKTSNESIEPMKVIHKDKNGRLFIKVQDNNRKFFDTQIGPIIFRKDYVEISSFLPSHNIYGLGQSKRRKFGIDLQSTTRWNLYSRHRSNESRKINWPGVHPFYLCMETNGQAHGVLVETTRPIEIQVNAGPIVTFRIIDDKLRLHFFFGPSPAEVVSQLLECVGKPLFPPYWALGHHICYTNSTIAQAEVKKLRNKKVELESVCLMSDEKYPSELINDLRSNEQKLLIIQSPHINYENFSYDYFIVNSNVTSDPFVGTVDNKSVIYPDFFDQNTVKKTIDECLKNDFDGLILSLNTPLDENNSSLKCKLNNNFAPYDIQLRNLSNDTVCWDSLHKDETQHYKVHNIYGHKYFETMWKCAKSKNKARPFVISASTFLGSGKFGGSWGGPNFATWEDLQQGIVDMLEYNMYGIPLTGVPYCGFQGNFTQTLCSRWLQVSALSPLMIGYREKDEIPVDLTKSSLTSTVGKMVLRLRYSLLPYLYTLFYRAHYNRTTVVRPVFFEFPTDTNTYHLNGQYMLGSALLVSPVIVPNVGKIIAYFPRGCWYSYYDGSVIISSGERKTLSTIESHINLHMRGGHIIPSRSEGLTVRESQSKSFALTVALKCVDDGVLAEGELFFDDGESNDYSLMTYMKVEAYQNNITFMAWPEEKTLTSDISYDLKIIRLFGMIKKVESIHCNNKSIDLQDTESYENQFVIQNLHLDLRSIVTITLVLSD
ncbi:maltase-glucoamylase, intestinal-like isoform X1 [Centruroides sculpturatus]|uniref:maltase-glucoamylase, intestinal-like isoform X1 n=2 Tax=Centruroides sculpturatus TaxID=218467 RepID=UPI000C6E4239|nr:maltase-glucoamylase, intestinal-like isoform X1 [Centruroides sculpturatus]